MRKYSKRFEQDYQFYLSSIGVFDFCGTLNPKFEAVPNGERTAKECFYLIDSRGKNTPCSEPELLNQLLLTKAAINFQIKQWAEGFAEGTLPLAELSKSYCHKTLTAELIPKDNECLTLEWIDGEPVYHKDIQTQYNLPDWSIDAIVKQGKKIRG